MLDTPSHEGNERGRTEIQSSSGSGGGGSHRQGGGPRLGREPADVALLAGPVRGGGAGGSWGPLPPAGALSASDAGRARGHGPGDAAREAVLGSAEPGVAAGPQGRGCVAVEVRRLPLPGP